MKLKEIYELSFKTGIEADPRSKEEIARLLNKQKKALDSLADNEKDYFDQESLENPFADTRILAGDPETEITGILTGIDLEVGEVLLADRLNEKGSQINLLLCHHPEGKALAQLYKVMGVQADVWHKYGVPINVADVLIDKRANEVKRNLMPFNHNRSVDAARLMGLNFMSCHTPADNLVTRFVQNHLDSKRPQTLGEVVKLLKEIPEYDESAKQGMPPTIIVGSGDKRPGKIVVDMTGGTEGPEGVIEKLAQAGVGTLIQMHLGDKLRKKAEEHHLNVVIAGHIPSDNIGMNLFLDRVEQAGVTNITPCSGLVRVKR